MKVEEDVFVAFASHQERVDWLEGIATGATVQDRVSVITGCNHISISDAAVMKSDVPISISC